MNLGDWLQIVSLVAVAIALTFTALQNRTASRQTSEVARQSVALNLSLEQGAYQMLVSSHTDLRATFLKDDPEMLSWYLLSRGYASCGSVQDKRTLYILLKLETHESTYLSHAAGLINDDVWAGWRRVIEVDFVVPEFVQVWSNARQFYFTLFPRLRRWYCQ